MRSLEPMTRSKGRVSGRASIETGGSCLTEPPAPITSRIRLGDLDVACRDAGGPGIPFVFQHGLGGDAEQTFQVLPDYPGIRPITFESRGHGGSDTGRVEDLSIATFTEDVEALIGRLIGGAVILGGISMGAAIALRLAVRRPDLVRALVLARPAWVSAPAPDAMRPNAEAGRLLAAHDPAEARGLFEASPTGRRLGRDSPANFASLLTFFKREPADVTAALLSGVSTDGPGVSVAEIQRIRVPTLVIGCDHDSVHPLATAECLARLIPRARFVAVTAKAVDRNAYVREFGTALADFFDTIIEG